MNRTFTSTLFVSALLATLAPACGAPVGVPDESACVRGRLEADLQRLGTLPALDGGAFVISSTYLRLKPTDGARQAFNEVMGPLSDELERSPVVAGSMLGLSEACLTARTVSVYRSEEDMLTFVTSAAHAEAIRRVGEISRGGSLVTHWVGPSSEATWETAAEKVGLDSGPFY